MHHEKLLHFLRLLKTYEQLFIIGHMRPDGDCIASQLGMQNLSTLLGLEAYCWNEGPFNRSESIDFKKDFHPLSALPRNDKKSALCLVDCSELSRAGGVPLWLAELPTFIVDHHLSVGIDTDDPTILCDPTTPASAAIVCELYMAAQCPISEQIATLLLMGIASDTFFFRYVEPHQHAIFTLTAHLAKCGASPRAVAEILDIKTTLPAVQMIGNLLQRASPIDGTPFLITTMTAEEKQLCGGIESHLLYDALLHIEPYRALVFLWEETKTIIVGNLRSKAPLRVVEIAIHFGGGGHAQAAGFRKKNASLDQIIDETKYYIKNSYKSA